MFFDELVEFLEHGFFYVADFGIESTFNEEPSGLCSFGDGLGPQHLTTGATNGKPGKPFGRVNTTTGSQIDKVGVWCASLSAARTDDKFGAGVAGFFGFADGD